MALTPINLSNLLTFTTDPDGTRVNAAGLIERAVTNQPRFDFHPTTGQFLGILCEEARTNHLLYSQELDNASWGGTATVTTDWVLAPDGTSLAYKVEDNDGAVTEYWNQAIAVTSSTSTRTASIFVKKGTSQYFHFETQHYTSGTTVNRDAYIDLDTGTQTGGTATDVKITPYVNGWFRVSLSSTDNATGNVNCRLLIRPTSNVSSLNSTLTGYTYFWGAQLEVGNVASSYIPTTTTSVGRSANLATIPVASIPSFNLTEGTFVATADTYDPTSDCTIFAVNNGTQNEQFDARFSANSVSCRVRKAGVNEVSKGLTGAPVADTHYKIALAYKLNDTHVMVNGLTDSGPDLACAMPTGITTLEFGVRIAGNFLNGHIKSLTYYPTRLTNTELEQVTTL